MAEAVFFKDRKQCSRKIFHPPKRAGELKYWYRAIRKVIPEMPEWQPHFENGATVTLGSIIMVGDCWSLVVARKGNL